MKHHTTDCARSVNRDKMRGGTMNRLWLIGVGALALVSLCQPAKAQSVPVYAVTTCGTPPTTLTNGKPAYLTVLVGSGVLCTNSSGGSGGGTSSNFNAAFPTAGTAIGLSNGTNMVPALADTNGYLEVDVKAGGITGATSNATSAQATTTVNLPPFLNL